MAVETAIKYTAKDFATAQDPKWCPGCGSFSIIKQLQAVLPELGVAPHEVAVISGIGCSSRFPYYMETYGMHTIHGRAPGIASGLKVARPDLNVWLITGDGDALSIGGNHFIHLLRRNPDINVILFNNRIYGLTKGQYSPTTPQGRVTKSSPYGTLDHPFNPLMLALGAGSTFIARGLDRNPKGLRDIFLEAGRHKGTSFTEVYQNCVVFNDCDFEAYSQKELKDDAAILLEEGKPLVFSAAAKGIALQNGAPIVVNLGEGGVKESDLMIHDPKNKLQAMMICDFEGQSDVNGAAFPCPFGIIYTEQRPVYEELVQEQLDQVIEAVDDKSFEKLLSGDTTWTI